MITLNLSSDTRYALQLQAIACGDDWTVILSGGESPHVGAVALAWPDPPLPGRPGPAATVCSLSAPTHRDDEVARMAAKRIAAALGCRVTVTVGIHIENAEQEELIRLQQDCKAICDLLLKQLKAERLPS